MKISTAWLLCQKCREAVPYKQFGYDFPSWHKDCTIFDRPGRTMPKQLDYASHGGAYSKMKAVTLIADRDARARLQRGEVKFGGSDLEGLALQGERV